MKKFANWTLLIFSVGVIALLSLWKYYDHRRTAITGDWSAPEVRYSPVHHGSNPDQSITLIHYYFSISQSAKLKNPYTVWRGTAWARVIKERTNTLAKGYGVSVLKGTQLYHHLFPAPILLVIWFEETALCQTEEGWFVLDGETCIPLQDSFTLPKGLPTTLLQKAHKLPTPADRYPQIREWILKKHLTSRAERNFYEPSIE